MGIFKILTQKIFHGLSKKYFYRERKIENKKFVKKLDNPKESVSQNHSWISELLFLL